MSKVTRVLESIDCEVFQTYYRSVNGGAICLNSESDHLFHSPWRTRYSLLGLKTVEECLEEYDVSLENGLNSHEVEKRCQIYGWNELQKKNFTPLWTEIGKIQAQIQEASMECHDPPLKGS